ncbi:centrosome-associated zinc finger protein CP190 [Daktulosphaira vitifoliae]|uniref:centrosome-associated zinc finger protein CP190 n=1 Tax=Daktulosphaira vitifoliae TaxID=58002 RepID=UPI0021AAB431|nr:centrosome-associated zinc finger protein CP190 [Daktulosphaira vitifoliae]XP_050540684.1 centrosome-associated zinc finger protein CP190 [Daktulosphaira vitifoliae]XP_050540685.1 centrosome-associated zinc finger protein CP190 [Daktulosphaira vitifoliae]
MAIPNQLKIDNWGNFFMQRLNNLAKKDEYCDYTIRSKNNESFKVHRVVLNTCSDYFVSHPNKDMSITMPDHLDFNAVKSVVMFMYTGQLLYTEDSRLALLEVADMLQVTVLLKLLESQSSVLKKQQSDYHSSPASTSRSHSAIALNQYRPAKKPIVLSNINVRSPPEHTPASTFINTMKVKDVLSENKPMRFDCDIDDVPEFCENTFELPKYDSAPLIKQENTENAKAMLKRTANGDIIGKKENEKPQVAKCDTKFLPLSPAGKKLKIVSETDPENSNSKVVQEILKKFPHLLQSKGNIKLKIMSSTNQSQFESIIINTPNSVNKILPAGTNAKEPLTTHKVKPDIMNIKGPWSCNLCGTESNPLKLDSYYTYRRHLVEKHNEKEDTRICEHCGHFSVRKSLQIHHMYTKHNITPPAEYKFPKCDQCGFIATTDVHLNRHKTLNKCCSKPQSPKKDTINSYTCSECSRKFRSSLMLKGHLRNFHKFYESPKTSKSKEIIIPVVDSASLPPGTKILAENKSNDKIEEVMLSNDESDVLKEADELIKDESGEVEESAEVETITLEDAAQEVKEKIVKPVDLTEEWDDFDDDTAKKTDSDKEDDNAKPCRIDLD